MGAGGCPLPTGTEGEVEGGVLQHGSEDGDPRGEGGPGRQTRNRGRGNRGRGRAPPHPNRAAGARPPPLTALFLATILSSRLAIRTISSSPPIAPLPASAGPGGRTGAGRRTARCPPQPPGTAVRAGGLRAGHDGNCSPPASRPPLPNGRRDYSSQHVPRPPPAAAAGHYGGCSPSPQEPQAAALMVRQGSGAE